MKAITTLGSSVGTRSACAALNVYRSRYYRFQRPKLARRRAPPPLKLSDGERQHIHELLVSPPWWLVCSMTGTISAQGGPSTGSCTNISRCENDGVGTAGCITRNLSWLPGHRTSAGRGTSQSLRGHAPGSTSTSTSSSTSSAATWWLDGGRA